MDQRNAQCRTVARTTAAYPIQVLPTLLLARPPIWRLLESRMGGGKEPFSFPYLL